MVDITGGTTSCMFKTYKREKQRLNKKNRPADHVAQDPVPPAVRRGPHLPWRGIRLVREAEATRIRIR